jgi:hypothetical protein
VKFCVQDYSSAVHFLVLSQVLESQYSVRQSFDRFHLLKFRLLGILSFQFYAIHKKVWFNTKPLDLRGFVLYMPTQRQETLSNVRGIKKAV